MRGSYQGIVPLRVLGLRALRQETVPAQRAPGFLHLPPVGALPRTPNEGWWPAHARCSCLGCDRLLLVLGHSALCPYVFLGFGSWADTEVRTLHRFLGGHRGPHPTSVLGCYWADTEVRTLHRFLVF